jgi:hypothetical protein
MQEEVKFLFEVLTPRLKANEERGKRKYGSSERRNI